MYCSFAFLSQSITFAIYWRQMNDRKITDHFAFDFIDYVEEIYQTYLAAHNEKRLDTALQELIAMTPAPMNTMLTKQSRTDVIQKRAQRKRLAIVDVPPTTPGTVEIIFRKDYFLKKS